MLVACTTSTEQDYASTGDVLRLVYGTTSTAGLTNGDLDHVGRLIRRASRWADQYVGYPLALQTYSESLPSYGGRQLMLGRVPLVKVLRLFDSTSTDDATEYCSTDFRVENYDAGIISRDGGWRWSAPLIETETCFNLGLSGVYRPGDENKPWLAEYVAGYKLVASTSTCHGMSTDHENWTTGPTIPDDITQAVAIRAAEFFSNPLNVTSKSVGDLSVSYGSAGPGSGARTLLDPYVRHI